ncbi:mimitin, mitochondrial isoform X3 [Carlito syrichta]|uniref:Mimitin, mitochondrial isoform X3 n=1 Tax=Carlito syrichta TaxID=1868482 RepID=A0A1U7TJQ3_CARSF|nr:mimitin, mitochondrial isoform X3 [Carlito syrichta]
MGWSQDVFRALWRSLSKEVKQHVGTDQLGNKYYYVPEYQNWRDVDCQCQFERVYYSFAGQTIREKRFIEVANKKEVDYEAGDIPTEWEEKNRFTEKKTEACLQKQLGLEKQERLHLLWRRY